MSIAGEAPGLQPLPRLVVRTIEVDEAEWQRRAIAAAEASTGVGSRAYDSRLRLLDLLPDREGIGWLRRGEGFVASGEAVRIETSGPGRFAEARRQWETLVRGAAVRDEIGEAGSGLVAFGAFAFASNPGHSVLVVPRTLVARRAGRSWITTVTTEPALPVVPSLDELADVAPVRRAERVSFADGDVSGPAYVASVAEAVRRIGAGTLRKVVLARDLLAVADEPFDVRDPLARLAERYPACWSYTIDGMFGATPEMLVRLENGLVTSRVLAGTIRRSDDDEADLALAASLARSSKDLEEHEFAVRSVAEALAPHCSSMNVPESPFVLHLANVMHLATDIAGAVADSTTSFELAEALHPSAAVCGTPTPEAVEAIDELEGMARGRYAGPVGWTDAAGNGEWGLALRCARVEPSDPTHVRLYAGCGIVGDSVPESELAEAQAKFLPIRDALTP